MVIWNLEFAACCPMRQALSLIDFSSHKDTSGDNYILTVNDYRRKINETKIDLYFDEEKILKKTLDFCVFFLLYYHQVFSQFCYPIY